MELVKVEAVGPRRDCKWDHKGLTQIVQIIVSYESDQLRSLQFQYLVNGGLQTSKIIGDSNFRAQNFSTIPFQSCHEYITKVEGFLVDGSPNSDAYIGKLIIHTNLKVYKIFDPNSLSTNFGFNFGGENQFGGFHGTYASYGFVSIGVYFNRLTSVPPSYFLAPVKFEEDEDVVHNQEDGASK